MLASTAQTTTWELEFLIVGTSTTAASVSGHILNRFDSTTALALTDLAPTANTGLSSGAQTLDLRFFMSSATPADAWSVQRVTMERLA